MGVDDALEGRGVGDMDIGAGDQGMMFGFACDETPEMMPMPIALAHRITRRLSEARRNGELTWLRPDGKSQVTIEYDGDTPVRVDTVVVSAQHAPETSHEELSAAIIDKIICKAVPTELMDENTRFLINPTGDSPLAAQWRFWPDRTQNHRGYLWRLCASRRRGIQRQRSDKGRPKRCICCALHCEKHRCRRSGQTLRN